MKKIVFITAALLMAGCSREFVEQFYDVNYEPTNRFATNLAELPGQFEKDTAALDSLINSFSGNIQKQWGKQEVKFAGKSNYVKYIDNYLSRAEVDFKKGVITIETVSPTEPQKHLKNAIITTLLTPDDPASVDLFSSKEIKLEGQPFLYKQVVDQDKQPIQWSWRASRFADYLIANQVKTKNVDFKKAYYVEISMVKDHFSQRSYQYANIVRRASKKYPLTCSNPVSGPRHLPSSRC